MKDKTPFLLKRHAVRASLLFLLATSCTVVFAQGGGGGGDPPGVPLNDITLVYRDWTGNFSATNRTWFYLDENGDEETTGYGI